MLGFAVPEIEASLRKTKRPYEGISREPLIVNERQKVRELFVPDGATTIELLEPLGEGSPLPGISQQEPSFTSRSKLLTSRLQLPGVTAARGRLVAPVPDVAFNEQAVDVAA